MTRRVAKVCICVSGRICVSLCERNSGQMKVEGRKCALCIFVCFYVCVRVSFIKERPSDCRKRKKERWPLAQLQGRDKKKERNRKKIEGTEEKGKVGRQRWHNFFSETWETFNGSSSLSLLFSLSLFLFSHFLFPLLPLSHFLSLSVSFPLSWGL